MAARIRFTEAGSDDDAVDAHLAMAAAEDAVEVQEQRRLAGAVGSHDGDLLAGRDLEVDAAQRLGAIGVGEVEVLDDDPAATVRRGRSDSTPVAGLGC